MFGAGAYAHISGAIFMKFGRAPQTLMIFNGPPFSGFTGSGAPLLPGVQD